jgi:hypothetical protein
MGRHMRSFKLYIHAPSLGSQTGTVASLISPIHPGPFYLAKAMNNIQQVKITQIAPEDFLTCNSPDRNRGRPGDLRIVI